jgi:hypothetical protein
MHWREEIAYNNFIGKPEEKRPLTRTRSMCEDNNKMNLTEIG